MGVLLTQSSSQYLKYANTGGSGAIIMPGGEKPWMLGCWTKPAQNGDLLGWGRSTGTTDATTLYLAGTGKFGIRCRTASIENTITGSQVITANTWHFVFGRSISSTSRRLSIIFPGGLVEHVQDTASQPAGSQCDLLAVGCQLMSAATGGTFYDGAVAECWWCPNKEVFGDVQLSTALLFQLAYQGPFSIPTLAPYVAEYLALRDWIPPGFNGGPNNNQRDTGINTQTLWTQVKSSGSIILTDHPPLPYSYVRPEESYNVMTV